MRLSIIVVEDHDALREVTAGFLAELGYEVREAPDAETLDELMAQWPADVVVLDVNLPGEDGYSVCGRLRAARPALGIVMLTARTAGPDRVVGYEQGADVYLAKPTANEELAAAIHSLARRLKPGPDAADLRLDEARCEIQGPGGVVALTESEAVALRALALAPGRQLEHWQLMEALGLSADTEGKAALEVRMVRLRRKLGQAGVPEAALQAVRRVGYRLQVRVVLQG